MYAEAVNLPFNGEILKGNFTPVRPGTSDPGGTGYVIAIQGNALLVDIRGRRPLLPEEEPPFSFAAEEAPLYIGTWKGRPLRVVRVQKGAEIDASYVAEAFNAVTERLDDEILSLGGMGLQLLHWQKMSAFCSHCGKPTIGIEATWGKKCTACSTEHFPHIHPCVIVLVKRGDSFLLGRKPEWLPGRYSLIAGFLDFGESLEECVQREVREEAGIEVCDIRYIGSQNWPFPSQLMAGFVAEYAGGEITLDGAELEDAQWFSPSRMPESLPSRRSIARWIIDRYAIGEY